uniref:RRM domain-containing protein n=1 Tax=Rhinopithecus roxellana TaxID=61622 RepID=A0A2K6REE1_RHIRO
MVASAARGAVALRRNIDWPVAFVRKIPWTAASSQLKEYFGTGFHRGLGSVQFPSEEQLQNALQQEYHIIDGVKVQVQAKRPKVLQTSDDEEKDF